MLMLIYCCDHWSLVSAEQTGREVKEAVLWPATSPLSQVYHCHAFSNMSHFIWYVGFQSHPEKFSFRFLSSTLGFISLSCVVVEGLYRKILLKVADYPAMSFFFVCWHTNKNPNTRVGWSTRVAWLHSTRFNILAISRIIVKSFSKMGLEYNIE